MSIDLSNSNSICDIRVEYINEKLTVIKTIANTERSKRSLELQEEFNYISGLESVNIIEKYIDDENIYFQMPYVKGYVGADIVEKFSHNEISIFQDVIIKYLDDLKSKSEIKAFQKEIIKKKISEIKKNINIELKKNEKDIFENSTDYIISQLRYIDSYPESRCHGDLTLSNMIYKNEKIYLIDFLDVYLGSYLVDIVKIEQDIIYGWSVRHKNKSLYKKNQILFMELKEKLSIYYEQYSDLYKVLSLMNTIRIIPYIQDLNTKNWVFNTIKKQYKAFNL